MIDTAPTNPIDLSMIQRLHDRIPDTTNFVELGATSATVIIAIVFAHFIAKIVARRVTAFVDGNENDEPLQYQKLLASSAGILRNAMVAIIIAVARYIWDWQLYSEVILGFALAISLAASLHLLLRAVNLGFWTTSAASVFLFAFIFSQSVGGITPVSAMLDQVSFSLGERRLSLLILVSAALIAIFLMALVRLGNRVIKLLLRRNHNLDAGQRLLGEKIAMVVLVVAAFFIGIDMLGIDLTAFAVFSGAFGLAIGFGLQKTFGNLIAGIILLMDRSIKPGDVIVVGDSFGWVNKIGIRAVSVLTRDGKEHLIPNENLMTNEVENWSYSSENVRVRIPVGVSYASDMDQVEALMLQAVGECKRILKRPGPNVWMTEYGDSSVNFELLVWIKDPQEGVGNVRSAVLKRLWKLFKEHNIEIPFPQRDINFRNMPPVMAEQIETPAPKRKSMR